MSVSNPISFNLPPSGTVYVVKAILPDKPDNATIRPASPSYDDSYNLLIQFHEHPSKDGFFVIVYMTQEAFDESNPNSEEESLTYFDSKTYNHFYFRKATPLEIVIARKNLKK